MSKKAHAIKPSNATAYSSNIPQTPFEQYAVSTFSTNMLHFREINPEYHSSNRHSSNRHSSNNQASFLAIRWINISRNKLFTAISTFDAKGNTSRGTNLETGRGFFCRNWSWLGAAFSRFSWLLVSSGCLWSSAGTTFRPLGGVLAARACFWLCLECAAFSNLISW